MALTYVDVLQPKGELDERWFRGLDTEAIQARLTAYLNEAYAKSGVVAITDESVQDDAAEAWTYYRAYNSIANDLAIQPSQVTFNEQGQRVIATEQYRHFAALADQFYRAFVAIVPEAERSDVRGPTGSMRSSFSF